jgi:uncharacterized protein with GYD domain
MAMYLVTWAHTAETWQRMLANPEDRRETLAALTEAAGGKLHGLWYAFGKEDGYTLLEAPDDVAVASVMVKVAASGAFRHLSTVKLLTVEEALAAFRRAAGVQYRAPGTPA